MFFLWILIKSQFRHLALRDTAAESSAWTSFAESFSWVALMLSYGRNSLNSEFRFRWTRRIHLSGFEVVITPHPMVVTLVVLWLSCDHIVTILWPYAPADSLNVTNPTDHCDHCDQWPLARPPRLGLAHVADPGDGCGALGDAPSDGHLRQRRLWTMLLRHVFHGIQQSRPCGVFPQEQVEQKSTNRVIICYYPFAKLCYNVKLCEVTMLWYAMICYDMLWCAMLKDNPLHVAFHVGRVIYGHLWSSMVIYGHLDDPGISWPWHASGLQFLCLVNGQQLVRDMFCCRGSAACQRWQHVDQMAECLGSTSLSEHLGFLAETASSFNKAKWTDHNGSVYL